MLDAGPVCDVSAKTCGLCTTDSDCASFSSTPYCDATSGGCVECTSSSECSGTTPICDNEVCRACRSDADCDTLACNNDGSCVPESAIVWVDPVHGADNGACSRTTPCLNLVGAVLAASAERPHIVYTSAGTIGTFVRIGQSTVPVVYVHASGTTFSAANGTPTWIVYASAPVVIKNAVFTGNTYPVEAFAPVTLDHVTFHDTKALVVGVTVDAHDITVLRSTDGTAAVSVQGTGQLTLDRAFIEGAAPAISAASGARVKLSNLMVIGGHQRPLDLTLASGELTFSTVVGGDATPTAPCALACTGSLQVKNSIIWSPTCVDGTAHDAVSDSCLFLSSIVSNATPPPGTTNTDPMFVNPAANDYHIQATSPARDQVDSGPSFDFEGDARPGGPKFDIGADEIP